MKGDKNNAIKDREHKQGHDTANTDGMEELNNNLDPVLDCCNLWIREVQNSGIFSRLAVDLIFYRKMFVELFLWLLTWPVPATFIPLVYLTTGLVRILTHIKGEVVALSTASSIWSKVTVWWHSQEFLGLENIPEEGGAVLVWYHGPLPVDYWGLITKVYSKHKRLIRSVVDKNLMAYLPLSGIIAKTFKLGAFSKVSCVDLLDDGHLIGVAPGGARECMFDDYYDLMWGKRNGFAKVSVLTRSPIIPIFTENIREAYSTFTTAGRLFRFLYRCTGIPVMMLFGGFPVKLTTHIGSPITPRKGETASMLQERVKEAMLDMVTTWRNKQTSTY